LFKSINYSEVSEKIIHAIILQKQESILQM